MDLLPGENVGGGAGEVFKNLFDGDLVLHISASFVRVNVSERLEGKNTQLNLR